MAAKTARGAQFGSVPRKTRAKGKESAKVAENTKTVEPEKPETKDKKETTVAEVTEAVETTPVMPVFGEVLEELPVTVRSEGSRSRFWEAVAAECDKTPGKWIEVSKPGKSSASNMAGAVNNGKLIAMRDHYKASARNGKLYVRREVSEG
nr:MAG TPA: hypothetical protein [Caudoviricetes sp.]